MRIVEARPPSTQNCRFQRFGFRVAHRRAPGDTAGTGRPTHTSLALVGGFSQERRSALMCGRSAGFGRRGESVSSAAAGRPRNLKLCISDPWRTSTQCRICSGRRAPGRCEYRVPDLCRTAVAREVAGEERYRVPAVRNRRACSRDRPARHCRICVGCAVSGGGDYRSPGALPSAVFGAADSSSSVVDDYFATTSGWSSQYKGQLGAKSVASVEQLVKV